MDPERGRRLAGHAVGVAGRSYAAGLRRVRAWAGRRGRFAAPLAAAGGGQARGRHPRGGGVRRVARLVLVPSLFVSDRVQCTTSDYWGAAVYYPCSGRYLWAEPGDLDALGGVLGGTRARCLATLVTPASTSEVATRLGIAPASVSEHLTMLRAAGLVSTARQGHSTVHRLTPLGHDLLRAAG